MEQVNPDSKIEINSFIEYNKGSSLDQMLNSYYSELEAVEHLIKHSNIIGMDQVVVSTADKPIIGTQALDTCFGILLYNRKNKFGICGHANPNNIIGIVVEMLKQIPQDTQDTFEYAIVPGYRAIEQHNFKGINEIVQMLESYSSLNPQIKFTSLKSSLTPSMPEGLLCYDFAFDTQSGKDVTSIVFMNRNKEQNVRRI